LFREVLGKKNSKQFDILVHILNKIRMPRHCKNAKYGMSQTYGRQTDSCSVNVPKNKNFLQYCILLYFSSLPSMSHCMSYLTLQLNMTVHQQCTCIGEIKEPKTTQAINPGTCKQKS